MEYKRLEQSLIDIVKEEQAKLGYRKEDVRLYYPLSTLNHFFDTEDTVEEMAERLTHLPEDMKARLGEIAVTHKKDRFCFHIPEQGSEYVHEHTAENEFIKELIELVREHGCTKKKILELFGQYSENTITEEMNNGEFDFYVRFPEGSEDRYYYCFKDEGCHASRFMGGRGSCCRSDSILRGDSYTETLSRANTHR